MNGERAIRCMKGAVCVGFAIMAMLLLPWHAVAEELTVAAASGMSFAMKELAETFQKKSGIHVNPQFGSSGKLFSQIQSGGSFDLYFSSNYEFPKKLEEAGIAVPGSLYKYAEGRLVIWVPTTSPVAVEKLGMEALLDPSVKKIAIPNPKHAPYGKAAIAALERLKMYDRVKDKLALGEDTFQAAKFVQSGASEIGFIALSLALDPSMKAAGRYWEIPPQAYPRLDQGAVMLKSARHPEAARAFLAFIQDEQGMEIMRRYGFVLPQTDMAEKARVSAP